MKTLRLRLTSADIEADPALLQAAEILRSGGLVAFPTETVYGLGANALDAHAVEAIFAAKQRPHWDPVIVHVADTAAARRVTLAWPQSAERLAEAFWPGPLTMLLPRAANIPDVCTAGREKVGLRMPSHSVALALIAAAGVPVAAPSANRFGHTSPTTAAHVLADLDGRIDAVLDAGPCRVGVESTVLDPTTDPAVIYRPGAITPTQIRRLLGNVVVAERNISVEAPPESLESPGIGIRHYAPRARLILVSNDAESGAANGVANNAPNNAAHEAATAAELLRVVEREARSCRVGVLLPTGWAAPGEAVSVLPWGTWDEPESLARNLYVQLRALDEQGVDVIVCPMPPPDGIGLAIRDRLRKAAK
jgi:L-threonylcarbamoyladenylate synthase